MLMLIPDDPAIRAAYAAVLRRDAAALERNLDLFSPAKHHAVLMLAQELYNQAASLDPP
jgi:hypothetical protein